MPLWVLCYCLHAAAAPRRARTSQRPKNGHISALKAQLIEVHCTLARATSLISQTFSVVHNNSSTNLEEGPCPAVKRVLNSLNQEVEARTSCKD